jgi:hypothetical protein
VNPDTRVSVHCYGGDGDQVKDALQLYLHHECPLTLVSPEDSPVIFDGIECRFAGTREGSVTRIQVPGEPAERIITAGPISTARQIAQMKLLLTYPESFFLMNDSDSFCLAPEIPRYVYRDPKIWCLAARNEQEHVFVGMPSDYPRFALQPPYFMHRSVMQWLIDAAAAPAPANPARRAYRAFIDGFMMDLSYIGRIPFENFHDGIGADIDRCPDLIPIVHHAISVEGKVFFHSAKSRKTWGPLIRCRQQFLETVL